MKLHILSCAMFCNVLHLTWSLDEAVGPPITKEEFEKATMKLYHFSEADLIQETSKPSMPCSMPSSLSKTKSYHASVPNRWPNGILPYSLGASLPQSARDAVAMAIKEIMDNSCVKIRPRTVEDQEYVHIDSRDTGCYAQRLGYRKGMGQLLINLQTPGCDTHATAVHELIHALGGTHEQNRPDRDEHVTVHWENIRTGFGPQFIRLQGANDPQKLESCLIGQTNLQNCVDGQTKSRTFGLPYDTNSVMHYRRTAFAIDDQLDTLTPKDPTVATLGNEMGMTFIDIRKLRAAYGCSMHSGTSSTMHVAGLSSTISNQEMENGSLVLISAPTASQIFIDFTTLSLKGSDFIRIRNGNDPSSPVLNMMTPDTTQEIISISSGSQIFLEFGLDDPQSQFLLNWKAIGGSCCNSFRFDMPENSFVATNEFLKTFLGTYTMTAKETTRGRQVFPVYQKDSDKYFSMANDTDKAFSWIITRYPGSSIGFFFFSGADCPLEAQSVKYVRMNMFQEVSEFSLTCLVDCGTPPSAQSLFAVSVSSGNTTFRSTQIYRCQDNSRLVAVCEGSGVWRMVGKATCKENMFNSEGRPREITSSQCGETFSNLMPKDNITIAYPQLGTYVRNRACTWSLQSTSGRFKIVMKQIRLQITGSCFSHHVTLAKLPGSIRFCGYGSNVTEHEYFSKGKDLEVHFKPDANVYTSPVFSIRVEVIS